MSAYMIAQITVHDQDRYQDYLANFMPVFQRHQGELLATSAKDIERVEGNWALEKVVVMKFPDVAAARAWYNDPDYQAMAEHRHASAEANIVLVEGMT